MKTYHNLSIEQSYKKLDTSIEGLSEQESAARLIRYGKNQLSEVKRKSLLSRFFDQLKDMMIIVLIAAAVISAVIKIIEGHYGELFESGLILLIVILNAVIGLAQESKANQALEALKNMNKPYAKVMREGEVKRIKSEDLVIGDIVLLEAGDIVPADLRLISSSSLKIEEAMLTGESLPSEKDHNVILKEDTPLGDRKNMVFSSGIVAYGRGTGVVVGVGMNTEVGKIAGMLNESKTSKTPLQVQLEKTAKVLSYLVLIIAGVIFVASVLTRPAGVSFAESIMKSFMTAVAIAVAAIPEGLPAVVTIVLALSVKKMSERNAIVRNLPAVETLGACEVICSDKTGTLTLNKMTVKQLFTISKGTHYDEKLSSDDKSVTELVWGLALCNDTIISHGNLLGDPTETALTAYAKLSGVKLKELKSSSPRVDEIPFDSKRKLMSTVHERDGKKIAYVKGAFDVLLNRCKFILEEDSVRKITDEDITVIKQSNRNMGSNALRVLALAYKEEKLEHEQLEQDLTFVGLVGMIDPPRQEVEGAVKTCKKAGMDAVMITGDHLDTAIAIAKQIGIYKSGDLAITGAELDKLTDEEFFKDLRKYKVYARVSPENKVRIVKAYKTFNIIVAMTGDGVNDAPSIKIADIGVGMGITGTDVSKGVSDIILTDDNFATIIAAVEEGRKAYANIKKAVQYLLSANIAEVLCVFITTIFLRIEFLTAVMILWINLVTDSLPALALGTEKGERDIMNRPPRKNNSSLFAGETGRNILIQGMMQTLLTMGCFIIASYVLQDSVQNHAQAVTMAFITLCFIQLFHSYNLRQNSESLFASNPFANKFLNLSFVVGAVLVLGVTLVPLFQGFFGVESITAIEYLISIGFAILIIPFVEIQKWIERRSYKKKNQSDETVE